MKRILLMAWVALVPLCARAAEVLACPAWEITVVDEAGKPLAGCAVLQEWGCTFRAGYVGAQTNGVTDAAGRISFPARLVSSAPPETSRWKKIRRALDGHEISETAATVFITRPGYQFAWIRKGDRGVVASRDGLRLRATLQPQSR